jgi:hypothetical protein
VIGLDTNNEKLNSVEITHLWSSYIFESMIHHVFSYFANTTEDYDIKAYVQYCHMTSRMHVNHYIEIFNKEGLPIPRGTTSEDVNINAPKLFSDKFIIIYLKNMAKFALVSFALAYTECKRDDIRKIFKEHLDRLTEIDQTGTELMVSKAIYSNPPYIEIPKDVEFIEEESFFAGFIGDKRPLTALEVKQLFMNLENNILGKALLLGFTQVVKSKEIHDYLLKGKEISDKYVKLFSDKLSSQDISISPSLESEVLALSGGESPFSDRLMLNHIVLLDSYGIGNYGMALAQSQRRDLSAMYGKIIVETGLFTDNGADLLIKHKWLEQPPLASERQNALNI